MRLFLLFYFFFGSFHMAGFSQPGKSMFDTLYALQDLRLTITYPFDSLYRTNQEEIDALLTIESNAGILLANEPLTLNLRGKFRRMKCDMPPLLLNFKKSTLRRLGLSEIDEIKLVTHCLKTAEGQENLREERLCYQVYEAISPYAYRSIWLSVTYTDALGKEDPFTSAAFFLEPDKCIMERYGLQEKKLFNVAEDSLQYESYSTMVAFNCLIGNRDYSVIMSRNAKLFFDPISKHYVVIPYDFDYSNVVAASYRRETRPEMMTHPYDRLYQGEYFAGKSGEILENFKQYEDVIMDRVMNAPNPMEADQRKRIAKYFEYWFGYLNKKSPVDIPYGTVIAYKGGL